SLFVSNYISPNLLAPTNGVTDGMVLSFDHGTNKWITVSSGSTTPTNSGPIALSISGTNVAILASNPLGCVTNALLPYTLTLTTNVLIQNPTGMLDGQRIAISFAQDGTGSRLASFDTKFAFGTDITGITLSTTASITDVATFIYNSTADKWRCVGFTRGY